MKIYIGHNGHDAKSRAFVAANQDNPAVEDVMDYLFELGPFTNYQGFPFVGVIMDDGTQQTLFNPASWEEVDAWLAGLPKGNRLELSRGEFLELFTEEELADLRAKELIIPAVAVFWEKFRVRSYISLTDPLTIASVQALEDNGFIAAGRAAAILGG